MHIKVCHFKVYYWKVLLPCTFILNVRRYTEIITVPDHIKLIFLIVISGSATHYHAVALRYTWNTIKLVSM